VIVTGVVPGEFVFETFSGRTRNKTRRGEARGETETTFEKAERLVGESDPQRRKVGFNIEGIERGGGETRSDGTTTSVVEFDERLNVCWRGEREPSGGGVSKDRPAKGLVKCGK
jgi:hypothetical protein